MTDEVCRYFMSEVGPLIGDALMRSGKSFSRLCSILRSSHFSAQASAQFFDLPFTLTKEFRSRFLIPRVRDDDIFQPKINSSAIGNENLCGFLYETFSVDRDGPLSTMIIVELVLGSLRTRWIDSG